MRKVLNFILFGIVFSVTSSLSAQDLLPSDSYYRDNIAVNEVNATAPSLRASGEDGKLGGNEGGNDDGFVTAPVGDAVMPLIAAGLIYGSVLFLRRRRSSI